MPGLYPPCEPVQQGRLEVGDGHALHWERCGRRDGRSALVLHGGPGSGCTPWHRRLFDPERYDLVLHDQRGCGRSTPHASRPDADLASNTTAHLLADIERLRARLGIERWLVLGGSWGSTLALAYAEAHPGRVSGLVLFGVTAGLRREFDRVFRGGLAERFPDAWQRLRRAVLAPGERDADVVEAVHRRLFDPDPEVRAHAAHEWCLWESAIPEWPPGSALQPRFRDPAYALAFARIVTHYVRHDAWLGDDRLIANAPRLAELPVRLIDGRHDPQTSRTAEALLARLPRARHVLVDEASHAAHAEAFAAEIVRATDELASA